jgi:hypothetical protein
MDVSPGLPAAEHGGVVEVIRCEIVRGANADAEPFAQRKPRPDPG